MKIANKFFILINFSMQIANNFSSPSQSSILCEDRKHFLSSLISVSFLNFSIAYLLKTMSHSRNNYLSFLIHKQIFSLLIIVVVPLQHFFLCHSYFNQHTTNYNQNLDQDFKFSLLIFINLHQSTVLC